MANFNFKPVPSEIVTSASTGRTTVRSTDAGAPYNSNLLNRLQGLISDLPGDNLFLDKDLEISKEDIFKLLSQAIIRFDNDPNFYTKRDYQYLIAALSAVAQQACNSLLTPEELEEIKSAITALQERMGEAEESVESNAQQIQAINSSAQQFKEWTEAQISDLQAGAIYLEQTKQNTLIAGDNITITDNTISATGGSTYTSGEGIKIENDSISAGWTGKPLTVSVNVGNYKAGDTITSEDSIIDILIHLLTKVIDVKVVAPTASLSGSGDKSVLYGTSIQPTLTVTLTDGKFESEDKANYNYSLALGTVLEGASIKKAGTTISTTNTISGNTIQCVEAGYKLVSPVTYTATADVSASKNTAYKNNKQASTKSYAGNDSLTVSGSVTYTPYYHAFIGELDIKGKTDDEIRSMLTSKNLQKLTYKKALPFAATNKSLVDVFSTEGNAIVIACPIKYDLNQVLTQGDRVPYEELFKLVTNGTKEYAVPVDFNDESVSYRVYLYKLYGSNPYTFEEISFKPHK